MCWKLSIRMKECVLEQIWPEMELKYTLKGKHYREAHPCFWLCILWDLEIFSRTDGAHPSFGSTGRKHACAFSQHIARNLKNWRARHQCPEHTCALEVRAGTMPVLLPVHFTWKSTTVPKIIPKTSWKEHGRAYLRNYLFKPKARFLMEDLLHLLLTSSG